MPGVLYFVAKCYKALWRHICQFYPSKHGRRHHGKIKLFCNFFSLDFEYFLNFSGRAFGYGDPHIFFPQGKHGLRPDGDWSILFGDGSYTKGRKYCHHRVLCHWKVFLWDGVSVSLVGVCGL